MFPATPQHFLVKLSAITQKAPAMLTVHHLGVSQSDRVVWLCEELEIPYDLVRYDRDPVTRLAPEAYKALHPYGTAPVIEDDGLVLGESGAILEYIAQTHGQGRLMVKPGEAGYADYLYWFHFANASMMTGGMMDMVIGMLSGGAETDVTPGPTLARRPGACPG